MNYGTVNRVAVTEVHNPYRLIPDRSTGGTLEIMTLESTQLSCKLHLGDRHSPHLEASLLPPV